MVFHPFPAQSSLNEISSYLNKYQIKSNSYLNKNQRPIKQNHYIVYLQL